MAIQKALEWNIFWDTCVEVHAEIELHVHHGHVTEHAKEGEEVEGIDLSDFVRAVVAAKLHLGTYARIHMALDEGQLTQ